MAIPLLNLGLTDDERRRRAIEEALRAGAFPRGVTPTSADSPPVRLPDIPPRPVPRPLPSPGIPGGAMLDGMPGMVAETTPPRPLAMPDMANAPLPEFRPAPITRAEELGGAKDVYMAGTPGRKKSALLGIVGGALQGLATGGGLGAAAGGALAGGAYGAIDPRGARERQFELEKKPRILERFGMEDRETAARMAAEKALRDEQFNQARLEDLRAETEERRARTLKLGEAKPERQPTPQRRLGINKQTGDLDYYDVADPEERKIFRPYVRETPARPQRSTRIPDRAFRAAEELDKKKRNAQQLWKKWEQTPKGPERKKLEAQASAAQDDYNAAVNNFGSRYGEWFEAGPGAGGWGYHKPRQQGAAPVQPQRAGARPSASGAQPAAQRKATVGDGFVNHVANTLKITPEEARRRIEADGYTIK